MTTPAIGIIAWTDLTVPNADAVRDFYSEVVGWRANEVDMGGYADYSMQEPTSGKEVAGVCHARGGNAELPAQWLVYITVADLDASIARCTALGGSVIAGPKGSGARYCVIRDPAGAVAALYQPAAGTITGTVAGA
jgi:predicted enzyme related to lactoylglutathione lyase